MRGELENRTSKQRRKETWSFVGCLSTPQPTNQQQYQSLKTEAPINSEMKFRIYEGSKLGEKHDSRDI